MVSLQAVSSRAPKLSLPLPTLATQAKITSVKRLHLETKLHNIHIIFEQLLS